MKKRTLALGLAAVFAALVAAGCGGGGNNNTNGATNTGANETPYQTQGVTHEGNKVTVDMKLDSFKLIPDKIVVKKGDVVTFDVVNIASNVPHDVVVPDLGDDTKSKILDPGQKQTYTFTADQVGTFKMVCDIPGHEESGMVGQFIVVE